MGYLISSTIVYELYYLNKCFWSSELRHKAREKVLRRNAVGIIKAGSRRETKSLGLSINIFDKPSLELKSRSRSSWNAVENSHAISAAAILTRSRYVASSNRLFKMSTITPMIDPYRSKRVSPRSISRLVTLLCTGMSVNNVVAESRHTVRLEFRLTTKHPWYTCQL